MENAFVASYVLLWILVALLAFSVLFVTRQMGEILLMSAGLRGIDGDGIEVGKLAPEFFVRQRDGSELASSSVLRDGGVLVFAARDCPICEDLLEDLAVDINGSGDHSPILVAFDEVPDRLPALPQTVRVGAFAGNEDVPLLYQIRVTPYAFGIDAAQRIQSKGLVNSTAQLRAHISA